MFEVIALPITLVTFCLYAFQTISGDHSRLGVSLSLVLGIVLSVFFLRKIIIKNEDYKDSFSKHREHLLAAGLIVLFLLGGGGSSISLYIQPECWRTYVFEVSGCGRLL